MAIFLNENSKVVVQGMTGSEGTKHTTRMMRAGTNIVGGVNPRKAGTKVDYPEGTVPVFGGPLDDDIVGTAGRLAAEEGEPGEGGPMIEALYVFEVPMALPLDAEVPEDRLATARKALSRAKEVGETRSGFLQHLAERELETAEERRREEISQLLDQVRIELPPGDPEKWDVVRLIREDRESH